MKDDQIAQCFEYLCEEDKRSFEKKFREQSHDSDQRTHTKRELILGAYLISNGFKVRYDYLVEGKRPDWCILDDKSVITGVVELTNFHIDKATKNDIENQRRAKMSAWYWHDGKKNNTERLVGRIREKAGEYKDLIAKLKVPYIIAAYPLDEVVIFEEELYPPLFDEKIGLPKEYPHVSGVLYITNGYLFKYAQNPNALQKFDLPSGFFSLAPEQGSVKEREGASPPL